MTSKIGRQDIIDMAVQAGFDDITPWIDAENVDQGVIDAANRWIDKMVSFAALVGFRVYEVEQEQCAAKVVAEGVAEYERGLKDGALLERNKKCECIFSTDTFVRCGKELCRNCGKEKP